MIKWKIFKRDGNPDGDLIAQSKYDIEPGGKK